MAHPTILSLFSGVGGLDLGIQLALPRARVLGYVERDAYAAAVLLARMGDSSLESAPVWIGDVQDVDGSELRGRVDIICGGFPCQDISVAGKGVGIEGKRSGLWSEIVRLAREIRPRYLFLENVSAITSRGLDRVLSDLAEIGFDAEWLCLRASDVGAPHRRERWFCLGVANPENNRSRDEKWRQIRRTATGWSGEELADAAVRRSRGIRRTQEPDGQSGCAGACGAEPDDSILQRPQGQQSTGAAAGAVERASRDRRRTLDDAELERDDLEQAEPLRAGWPTTDVAGRPFPPGPADHDAWRAVPEYLAPAVEPCIRVLVDGIALVVDESRADQLRCCGNGVVALQASVAFTELLSRSRR